MGSGGTADLPACDTLLAACSPWAADILHTAGLPGLFREAWRRPLGAHLGDVHVWCLPAGVPQGLADHGHVLDGEDWAAIASIRDIESRDDMRTTRIALRLALSHAVGDAVPPSAWRFRHTSYGKPQTAPELPQVHFCTSHTDTLSVIAVSALTPVGVDAETIVGTVDDGLVAAVCSARERRSLSRLPDDARRHAFTKLWTLKEAYSKLTGTGLATDFKSVAFQVEGDRHVASRNTWAQFGDVSFTSWLAEASGGLCQVSVALDGSDPAKNGGDLVCFTMRAADTEPAAARWSA